MDALALRVVGVLVAGLLGALAVSYAAAPVALADTASAAAAKGDPKDCDDFSSQKKAQKWFKKHNPRRDPAGLDADNDGIACEENPCPCTFKVTAPSADRLLARLPSR